MFADSCIYWYAFKFWKEKWYETSDPGSQPLGRVSSIQSQGTHCWIGLSLKEIEFPDRSNETVTLAKAIGPNARSRSDIGNGRVKVSQLLARVRVETQVRPLRNPPYRSAHTWRSRTLWHPYSCSCSRVPSRPGIVCPYATLRKADADFIGRSGHTRSAPKWLTIDREE